MRDSSIGFDVSRETLEKLREFESMITSWNSKINLVAKNTVSDLWHRHIIDSAQLWKLAPHQIKSWTDLGSGGGFPGIIVAILAADMAPEVRIDLVESDKRKSAFLQTATHHLSLSFVNVHPNRAEYLPPHKADVVSARALAPLPRLLELVSRHKSEEGTALLLKGKRHKQEVDEAKQTWDFELKTVPSRTDPESAVLILKAIRHAS